MRNFEIIINKNHFCFDIFWNMFSTTLWFIIYKLSAFVLIFYTKYKFDNTLNFLLNYRYININQSKIIKYYGI